MKCRVKEAISMSLSTGVLSVCCQVHGLSPVRLPEPTPACSSIFEALGQIEKGLLKIQNFYSVY